MPDPSGCTQADFPLVSIRGVKFFGHQRPLMLLRTIHKRHQRFLTRSPSPGLFNHGCIRRTRSSSPIHPLPFAFFSWLRSDGTEVELPTSAISDCRLLLSWFLPASRALRDRQTLNLLRTICQPDQQESCQKSRRDGGSLARLVSLFFPGNPILRLS